MHKIDLPDWIIKRGQAMNSFPGVEPATTALVVVDMQNAYMAKGESLATTNAREIVPNVNRLSAAVRAMGGKVFFLRQTYTDDGPRALPDWQKQVGPKILRVRETVREGSLSHDICGELHREPGDVTVNKYRHSAFARHSSELETQLHEAGVDTLIIVGIATNICCESTARDAFMLGFKVFFVADATAALTDEEHNAALLSLRAIFADVRMTDEMLGLIEAAHA